MATLVLEIQDKELKFFKKLLRYFPFVKIKNEEKESNGSQVRVEIKED